MCLNPPAPRPLDQFTVTIENGEIKVDTSQPYTRQAFDSLPGGVPIEKTFARLIEHLVGLLAWFWP